MNRLQRHAIDHHCRLAIETMHPERAKAYELHSIVLSLNSGYE